MREDRFHHRGEKNIISSIRAKAATGMTTAKNATVEENFAIGRKFGEHIKKSFDARLRLQRAGIHSQLRDRRAERFSP